jgi:manganese/zinc/iron transport system permease protein
MGLIADLFSDYTLRTVALGSAVIGVVSGVLGSFAVLRRQSLLGDAISHAALPGIVVAYLLTGSKSSLVLVAGAAAAGWLGTLVVMSIVRASRIKSDSALGIVLSVFFGVGLVLLTFLQRRPDANQAGLDKFLFGQAAALVQSDVITMAVLGGAALVVVGLLYKEFKLLAFDPAFGASLGFQMRVLDVALTSLLVVAIVLGLQTVGVVLMSAMVVAPAAGARQWTDRLGVMIALAATFGAASGVGGALISSSTARLPTGPTIVLFASAIVMVSLLFAPNRGLIWNQVRRARSRRRLRAEVVLADLFALWRQHEDFNHAHPAAVLEAMALNRGGVAAALDELATRELAKKTDAGWTLTPEGLRVAQALHSERVDPDSFQKEGAL